MANSYIVVWHLRGYDRHIGPHVTGPFLNEQDADEWARREATKSSSWEYLVLGLKDPQGTGVA